MSTTSKGAPFPVGTDANNVPDWMHQLANWIDARPGVSTFTTAQRDVLTGADVWAGRVIFNSTTQQLELNKSGAAGAGNWAQLELGDAAAAVASLRTLGTGATQAAAGDHGHTISALPVAASGESSTSKVVRADDARLSNARTPTAHSHIIGDITSLAAALAALAPLADPVFTGAPQATKAPLGDDSNRIATTSFVQDAIGRWPNKGGMSITFEGSNFHADDVSFPHAFTAPPLVFLQLVTGVRNLTLKVDAGTPVTTTGFRYKVETIDGSVSSASPTINWIAIGELA